ncbi:hypothetical protein DB347_19985 [Opitutaceae bacterium EW11]|nr:hypothetical protein DB347_19985 [Opitutaceae bacterium EW11]
MKPHPFRAALGMAGALLLASVLAPLGRASAPEPVADAILREIYETQQALRQKSPNARFLAFWDFDGTILKGDCSEGYEENGRAVYPGLAQVAIEHGLASGYRPQGGFAEFWHDYRTMDERIGHWLAYPYLVQMLAGARADDVSRLAREHFQTVLAPYVFAASRHILDDLAAQGVENHILSASAEVFVQAGSSFVGVPIERAHGIRVRIVDGRLTHELVYPVTFADGKRERLEQILAEARRETPDRDVFVIAAFGNSYSTDSAFLAYTARQQLPAGHGVAVMFNGGTEPERWKGAFRRAEIDATVGAP